MSIRPIGITFEDEMFNYETFLTAEAASGGSSLTVKSISGFAIDQILLIGELGDENSEIINTHAATAPSGTTITLASNLVKTHPPYTKVRTMLYNQVEISHASTTTGSKSVLDTIDIQPEAVETRYDDSTASSGYYFTRYKNSIDDSYSDYSDPIPYVGFGEDTVAFAVNYALKRNKLETFTNFIDYQFCLDEINSCLQFITGKLKGWSKLLVLNYVAGQTSRGTNKVALPSDIWENKGTKSILEARIGDSIVLEKKGWLELEDEMEGVTSTQVTTEASAGATSLAIDNSYDFDDSGSVNIYISGTLYTLTYTGVTRSATAGHLTGIPASGTGAITVTIPADTYVWQGEGEGSPEVFSVDSDGNLVFYPLADSTYDNLNIYLDYWTGTTEIDSDADTLDHFRYDAVKHWLTWAIRAQLKNDGRRDFSDGDYLQFSQILADYIRNEYPSHRHHRGTNINTISY
jgi:hypothetical protein